MYQDFKLIGLCSVILLCQAAHGKTLELHQGTIQIGTQVVFSNITASSSDEEMSGSSLDVTLSMGYFVIENLEFSGGLDLSVGFGDLYKDLAQAIAFVGAQYFIPLGDIYFHLGFNLGLFLDTSGNVGEAAIFVVPAGLLIPLNNNFAVDIGINFLYYLGLDRPSSMLMIQTGFLGIRSFFN